MKTIVLPTDFPTRIEIPDDYPIPPVGTDFYINYENVCPAKYWGEVSFLLGQNVLTVEKIEDGEIFLHEGALPMAVIEDTEEWKALFSAYWLLHPETDPNLEPYPRKFIATYGSAVPFKYPIDGKEVELLDSFRVIGVFDTFDEWEDFQTEFNAAHDIVKADVSEWPSVTPQLGVFGEPLNLQRLIDEFLASGAIEPYHVVMTKKRDILWVDRTDRKPHHGKGEKEENSYYDYDLEIPYSDGDRVEVWCLARSSRDACRMAVFNVWLESMEDGLEGFDLDNLLD